MAASTTLKHAVTTAVAFVISTIAIPTLHLVFHTLPHDHDGGEIHYHVASDDHGSDQDDHRAVELPEEPEPHHDAGSDQQPFDPHHGEGSAAHFSLVLNDGAASAIDLALIGLVEQGRVTPDREPVRVSNHVSVVRLRGPPLS